MKLERLHITVFLALAALAWWIVLLLQGTAVTLAHVQPFSAVVATVLLSLVIARLMQLQLVDYQQFVEKSRGNRVRIEAVPPIRGLIFDRRGRVLAENLPAYQLELIPEQVTDIDDTLHRLARMDLIQNDDIERFKELARRGPRFKPVTLRFRLNDGGKTMRHRPAWLSLVLICFVVGSAHAAELGEDGFADSDGVKIHYVTMGKGPLVVLIHGFPDYWYTWRKQMPALARHSCVVALSHNEISI